MRQELNINVQPQRASLVRRGRFLEYFTIGYNSLEGLIGTSFTWLLAKVHSSQGFMKAGVAF